MAEIKHKKNPHRLVFFFQHIIPGKLRAVLKGQRKVIHMHLLRPHKHTQGFSTQTHALLVKRKPEKKKGRLKPAVLKEPPDLNANTILNIPPERVQTVWDNGQGHLLSIWEIQIL